MKTDRSPLPPGTQHTLRDIRRGANMDQKDLANEANVSPGVVLKMEQFILNKAPLSVLKVLEPHHLVPVDLQEVYISERQAFIDTFFERFALNDYTEHFTDSLAYAKNYMRFSFDKHPVKLFRQYLSEDLGIPTSQIKFCMYTGFHPATLSGIESGKYTWKECGAFNAVLQKMRVPSHLIEQLAELNDQYYVRAPLL